MKKVQLADRLGNIQTKRVGFSWAHFFLGPIHSLFSVRILTAIFELFLYFMLLPIPGMEFIVELLDGLTFISDEVMVIITTVLLFFRTLPNMVFGIIFVSIIHILICSRISANKLRRYIKRSNGDGHGKRE